MNCLPPGDAGTEPAGCIAGWSVYTLHPGRCAELTREMAIAEGDSGGRSRCGSEWTSKHRTAAADSGCGSGTWERGQLDRTSPTELGQRKKNDPASPERNRATFVLISDYSEVSCNPVRHVAGLYASDSRTRIPSSAAALRQLLINADEPHVPDAARTAAALSAAWWPAGWACRRWLWPESNRFCRFRSSCRPLCRPHPT